MIRHALVIIAATAAVAAISCEVGYNKGRKAANNNLGIRAEDRSAVDAQFRDFLDGRILRERTIDVFGQPVVVSIVDDYGGVERGFVSVPQDYARAWLLTLAYETKRYDAQHLHVVLVKKHLTRH